MKRKKEELKRNGEKRRKEEKCICFVSYNVSFLRNRVEGDPGRNDARPRELANAVSAPRPLLLFDSGRAATGEYERPNYENDSVTRLPPSRIEEIASSNKHIPLPLHARELPLNCLSRSLSLPLSYLLFCVLSARYSSAALRSSLPSPLHFFCISAV